MTDAAPALTRPPLLVFDAASVSAPTVQEDAYSLRLVSSRKLYDLGTFVQKSSHLAPLAATSTLLMHPSDLERLGLAAGGSVRVHGIGGNFTIDSKPDNGVPRGSVFLGFNVNGEQAADLIDVSNPITDVRVETVS